MLEKALGGWACSKELNLLVDQSNFSCVEASREV